MGVREVTVEAHIFGMAEAWQPLPTVRIPLECSRITPRELIAKAVARQLDELRERREDASRVLARHYLQTT